jgi:hypothetical protein
MEAPFDRGEIDRASLDATERLRTRLSGRPIAAPQQRGRSVLPWVVAAALFVFAAGMIANPWFESTVRSQLPFAQRVAGSDEPAEVKALNERLALLEARTASVAAPAPSERLARTEAQIETSTDQIARDAGRIDKLTADLAALSATVNAEREQSQAATAQAVAAADRAQGMLTLVLVRRAVDAGRPFGALDAVLRHSFEARYPQAVQQVSALGAAPVSLGSLRRDFDALRPAIGARPVAGTRQGWWDTLTTTMMDAVSRPAADAPPEAAATALARGDVQAAANHLRRLPAPRPPALSVWLAAADRLQAGNAALATLETAVVLVPAPAAAAAPVVPAAAAPVAAKPV